MMPHFDPVAPRMPSAPRSPLMEGAWDVHCHVFGPYDVFPLQHPPSYPPPDAPAKRHQAMLLAVGAAHGVLVQPAPYGTNADALVDALGQARGRLRGVSVATNDITDRELERLHAAGVRGLRFVDMRDPSGKPYAGSISARELAGLAPRLKELGWHAVVWAPIETHAALLPDITKLGVPLVLDHMACLDTSRGRGDAAFKTIVAALKDEQIYVKLTVCRVAKDSSAYAGLKPFHDALVKANPDRLLWGSDWPFVRMGEASPNVGRLIDLFHTWVEDPGVRRKVLVDNPARLYA